MALTINTHPTKQIINAPEFNVETDLPEDGSHQNLRIRATVYAGGESSPIAVLEQPKGIDDWDFFSLLKDKTGKNQTAAGGSDKLIQPTISSELLTGWTNSGWDNFASLGRAISQADNAAGVGNIYSDTLSISKGDLIIVGVENDFADTGVQEISLLFRNIAIGTIYGEILYVGLTGGRITKNHLYYFLATDDSYTDPVISLYTSGNNAAEFIGSFTIHTISDFQDNPGVFFRVKFEEVYENASNVTTIGAESFSDTMLFVPVIVRPDESFDDDYLMNGDDDQFLNRSADAGSKYKFGASMEMRLMFVSTNPYFKHIVITDAEVEISGITVNTGWGILIINDTSRNIEVTDEDIVVNIAGWDPVDNDLWQSEFLIIETELNCYPDITVLGFIGQLGEETILFRGLPDEVGSVLKSFYRDANNIRKVLSADKSTSLTVRTLIESEEFRRLLHELCYTELPVWMFDTDFTDNYREVTVITDASQIKRQKEQFETDIELEYFE